MKCKICDIFPAVIDGYCKNCLPKKEKKRKYINPMSKKRIEKTKIYKKLREEFFNQDINKLCKANLEGCKIIADDIHHLFLGSNREEHMLDFDNCIPVCRHCHYKLHNETKEEYYQLGLLKRVHE